MLTYFVIVPVLTAVLLYLFSSAKSGRVLAILIQTGFVGAAYYLFTLSRQGEIITSIGNYGGILGIYLRADNLAAVFVLLTAIFFLLASIYSFREKDGSMFWFLIFIWQGALIGLFLTRDFFNVFVLVEVVTMVVAVLIMFNRDTRSMYDGMIYLLVNITAMKFFLFGLGYLYRLTGALDMATITQVLSEADRADQILPYALIMTAVALKCALMPLFSWLPKAHGSPAAPPAVSAILSGLHIKSGVYLFIRFQDVFAAVAATEFFLVMGVVTGIIGFIMAMSQNDIKLILAYSTISQVGLIFVALNIPDPYSYVGGLYHVINHALFKGCLFLGAGVITKVYGTRDIYAIRGVLRRMPWIGAATLMAVLGIAGAPFFNGSISKYFMVAGAPELIGWVMVFMSLGTIIVFIKYATILFGSAPKPSEKEYPILPEQQFSIFVLGLLCCVTGILGVQTIQFLFQTTVYVDFMGYLEKVLIFFISLGVGYLIYKYFVKTSALLRRVRAFELGFREICASMGVFFAMILLAVGLA
ncbi:MAG: proton-conducting membrane transporter [Oscillospiraceae bacterium]|nr:proton-conducting membrane transporter [Oscillospiraceae bacterium]